MKINMQHYKSYIYYKQLSDILQNYKNKEIVFFCAGNYKIWFDCFAPLVGELLRLIPNNNCFVYGGTKFPITAENITEYMDFINAKHPNACIIVIDNCITLDASESGKVIINPRTTKVAGLTNNRMFGDISILLKTYTKQDSYYFLKTQQTLASMLVPVLQKLINNRLII